MIKKLTKVKLLCLILMMIALLVGCASTNKSGETNKSIGNEQKDWTQQEQQPEQHERVLQVKAEILEKVSEKKDEEFGFVTRTQIFKVKILQGKFKGEVVDATNVINQGMAYTLEIKDKDKYVMLHIEEDENGGMAGVYIAELVRDRYMLWLAIIFILLMVIVGGLKGVKALITLVLITVAIFKYMLPRILLGEDPVILTIYTAMFVIITTLIIIAGFNKKSLSAIVGTIGGVIGAAVIAYTFEHLANVTGLAMEEAQGLMFIPQATEFNFQGLFLAGILLGALGAVMDVSMSISSSIKEIYEANKDVSVAGLFKSGMNVGKDIMGTMSNTLILAYTGASMNLILLLMAHKVPINEIMNKDLIASEIVRGLTGTIGLILTIPITAFVAAYLYKSNSKAEVK